MKWSDPNKTKQVENLHQSVRVLLIRAFFFRGLILVLLLIQNQTILQNFCRCVAASLAAASDGGGSGGLGWPQGNTKLRDYGSVLVSSQVFSSFLHRFAEKH